MTPGATPGSGASKTSRAGGPGSRPGPFVLDVRTLGRRAGTMSEIHRTVTTPDRIGVEMVAIPADSEVDLDLRLESVTEGVLVTGTVCGETVGQCARCLEPLDGTVTVFLTELFAYPDSATEQTTDADDIHRIVDDHIDLEQSIIDAVALELPMSPLCSDDCPGLCPVCGVRLAIAEPGHGHEIIDPRWAGLADKFGDLSDGPDVGDSTPGSGSDGD
ncbi:MULTISPECIES: YceD family protein [unclassified Gordonia (in: high G+C Gram-positive bacteria)]|uniref:YceD family protein n=1 Tax=Gordonia sp. B7-2 TaxID=3420932 RepID=UPI003D8FFFDC